jgi:hypothetical protein
MCSENQIGIAEEYMFTKLLEEGSTDQACHRRTFLLQFLICFYLVGFENICFCTIVVSNYGNICIGFVKEEFHISSFKIYHLENSCRDYQSLTVSMLLFIYPMK